ncbi:MAG: sugar isomerase, partial [bacterium]|nr:sugar isomerase [bacterium]
MTNHGSHNHSHCGCCGSRLGCQVSRRGFMAGMGAAAGTIALSSLTAKTAMAQEPIRLGPVRLTTVVQPVLVYSLGQRTEGTSWRNWGGLHTPQDVADEQKRIAVELEDMQKKSDFPMEIRPLLAINSVDEAKKIAQNNHDVVVLYAAGGWGDILETLTDPQKATLIFLRHRSGPVYLWYEIISNRYLRKTVDEYGQPGITPKDVVVDRYDELLWRLRALAAIKNTRNKKVLCVGGASGWGVGGQKAPQLTKDVFGIELVDVSYDELGQRILKMRARQQMVQWCNEQADAFLKRDGISLHTDREFVRKCFLLTEVFHELMAEHKTDALTINACMGTIMQVSETTACLPLMLLNDAGYMAFCESDFVVIPSGILLHYISGKPVFLNDPTYPHDQMVTLAHCTAPSRMDGLTDEPAKILTHFESDWGAAPKVEMKHGQIVTTIDP